MCTQYFKEKPWAGFTQTDNPGSTSTSWNGVQHSGP